VRRVIGSVELRDCSPAARLPRGDLKTPEQKPDRDRRVQGSRGVRVRIEVAARPLGRLPVQRRGGQSLAVVEVNRDHRRRETLEDLAHHREPLNLPHNLRQRPGGR
jgi:hypothetical protein